MLETLSALGDHFVVVGDQVMTGEGLRPAAIQIQHGKIVAVGAPGLATHLPQLDVGSLTVLPGVVDTHVHVNEPGRTEWEGFSTATRAAAAGGITTLVDMPLNSIPVTTSLLAYHQKVRALQGSCQVDVGLWGGVVPGNAAELGPMIDAGVLGFKCFLCPSGIDDFPPVSEGDLRRVMPILAARGVPLLVHAELCPAGTPDQDPSVQSRRYVDYLQSRPSSWEDEAIRLMIRLCRETGCRVHIVHLSSADALVDIAEAKAEGLPFTVETCPHYLHFEAEEIPDGATWFKCAPPIRPRENRARLWEGLRLGIIDFVVCDHSPCTPGLKLLESGDFLNAWGGIASLQLSPSVVWSQAEAQGFDLTTFVDWTSVHTARFAGLFPRKGILAVGSDADLVVMDPHEVWTVQGDALFHRHKLSPYVGRQLRGRVITTFLRGRPVFHRGQPLGEPGGQHLTPLSS